MEYMYKRVDDIFGMLVSEYCENNINEKEFDFLLESLIDKSYEMGLNMDELFTEGSVKKAIHDMGDAMDKHAVLKPFQVAGKTVMKAYDMANKVPANMISKVINNEESLKKEERMSKIKAMKTGELPENTYDIYCRKTEKIVTALKLGEIALIKTFLAGPIDWIFTIAMAVLLAASKAKNPGEKEIVHLLDVSIEETKKLFKETKDYFKEGKYKELPEKIKSGEAGKEVKEKLSSTAKMMINKLHLACKKLGRLSDKVAGKVNNAPHIKSATFHRPEVEYKKAVNEYVFELFDNMVLNENGDITDDGFDVLSLLLEKEENIQESTIEIIDRYVFI